MSPLVNNGMPIPCVDLKKILDWPRLFFVPCFPKIKSSERKLSLRRFPHSSSFLFVVLSFLFADVGACPFIRLPSIRGEAKIDIATDFVVKSKNTIRVQVA